MGILKWLARKETVHEDTNDIIDYLTKSSVLSEICQQIHKDYPFHTEQIQNIC